MAKEKDIQESAPVKSDRELRWEALQEVYAKQNPSKYEAKKKSGKFDKIPASFI